MFLIFNIILYGLAAAAIALYIFKIVIDVSRLRRKGTIFYTERRKMNVTMIMLPLMITNLALIYLSHNQDRRIMMLAVLFGLLATGYWTWRAFSRQRLCEHVLVTHQAIYLSKDCRGHEWSTMMTEEGKTKLWIKLYSKSMFGRNVVKEVCFMVPKESITDIERALALWAKMQIG